MLAAPGPLKIPSRRESVRSSSMISLADSFEVPAIASAFGALWGKSASMMLCRLS